MSPSLPEQHPEAPVGADPAPVIPAQAQHDQYNLPPYDSLFQLYPLLRSRSQPISFPGGFGSHQGSISELHSSNPLPVVSSSFIHSSSNLLSYIPDLKPLRLATIVKALDPNKMVCQYEVPGGGMCRDERCEDVHLSRIVGGDMVGHTMRQEEMLEPTDQDTAQYLYNALPSTWRTHYSVQDLEVALQDARGSSNAKKPFEERVMEAISALGRSDQA